MFIYDFQPFSLAEFNSKILSNVQRRYVYVLFTSADVKVLTKTVYSQKQINVLVRSRSKFSSKCEIFCFAAKSHHLQNPCFVIIFTQSAFMSRLA